MIIEMINIIQYVMINAITIYIFIYKPFQRDGQNQRIMW